ncbi:MAG: hypothetical protein ACJA08_003329 [Cyclobacteriaceae bacterium]|jgi:hypothetical protein
MIKFRFIMPLMIVVLVTLVSAKNVLSGANIENFVALSEQLDQAVELRDFHKAREVIDELLPMMKEDIKTSKKTLNSLKKEENPEIPADQYEIKLNRKAEIYESVKHTIELSSASLRVKSSQIVSEVDEFVKLMD